MTRTRTPSRATVGTAAAGRSWYRPAASFRLRARSAKVGAHVCLLFPLFMNISRFNGIGRGPTAVPVLSPLPFLTEDTKRFYALAKYRLGLPFFRLSKMLSSEGLKLDDGAMCRYAEDVGATLGVIVVACAQEARRTAFCLAIHATGGIPSARAARHGRTAAVQEGTLLRRPR
jgi:hypothetical protein